MDAAVIVAVAVVAVAPTGFAVWGRLVEWWQREPVCLDALDGVGLGVRDGEW